LQNERGDKAIAVLLLGIPEIKIIIHDLGFSDCVLAFNILDNCGSGRRSK
jgi:hypothetical protein